MKRGRDVGRNRKLLRHHTLWTWTLLTSLRHLLVSTPKKHLLLIKNRPLLLQKQLIFCLIMVAVYGSQQTHSCAALGLKSSSVYVFQCLNKSFSTCQLLFPPCHAAGSTVKCTQLWSRKLSSLSVLPADQTGWDIRFFPVFSLNASEIYSSIFKEI